MSSGNKQLARRLKRLFCPVPAFTWSLTAFCAVALVAVFRFGFAGCVWSWALYALSLYACCAASLRLWPHVKRAAGTLTSVLGLFGFVERTELSLVAALTLNLLFGLFKLLMGMLYASFWFGAVGMYYMILSLTRFLLLRQVRGTGDPAHEQRRYRICGWMIISLGAAFGGMAAQMVLTESGGRYPGYLIYAAAFYAFYRVIVAAASFMRSVRHYGPAVAAARSVSLVSALVALVVLQTAMFASFGDASPLEQRLNAISGGVVTAIILCLGLAMVLAGRRHSPRQRPR